MNLPNKISIARIALIPVFIAFYYLENKAFPKDFLVQNNSELVYEIYKKMNLPQNLTQQQDLFTKLYFKNFVCLDLFDNNKIAEEKIKILNSFAQMQSLSSSQQEFILSLLNNSKNFDYKKMKTFLAQMKFDENVSKEGLIFYMKSDKIDYLPNEYRNISSFNKYVAKRNIYDPEYVFSDFEYQMIQRFELPEEYKLKAVNKAFKSKKKDKYKLTLKYMKKYHNKLTRKERFKDSLHETFVETPKLAGKCFISTDEHMTNMFSRDANNVAFVVGLINPINAVTSFVALPFYIIFKPLQNLP